MNLLQALNANNPLCTAIVGAGPLQVACVGAGPLQVACVGAGGKTTAMFSLARQVVGRAWVSTSTHLGTDQAVHADQHFILNDASDFKPALYRQSKVTLLTGPVTVDDRLHSPAPDILEMIHQAALVEGIPLILEADGSRSIPLKAPGDHEPPIPDWVNWVIVVVGFSGIGRSLTNESVFRAERFSQLTGLPMGETIRLEHVRDMLLHPLGGLKNIPTGTLKAVLFNQAESAFAKAAVKQIAPDLLRGGYDRIIAGGLKAAPDELVSF